MTPRGDGYPRVNEIRESPVHFEAADQEESIRRDSEIANRQSCRM
jgi:hypothetical protein